MENWWKEKLNIEISWTGADIGGSTVMVGPPVSIKGVPGNLQRRPNSFLRISEYLNHLEFHVKAELWSHFSWKFDFWPSSGGPDSIFGPPQGIPKFLPSPWGPKMVALLRGSRNFGPLRGVQKGKASLLVQNLVWNSWDVKDLLSD